MSAADLKFGPDDFELLDRYPTSRPFGDVPAEDKARFKSIRDKLKEIARLAADQYPEQTRDEGVRVVICSKRQISK